MKKFFIENIEEYKGLQDEVFVVKSFKQSTTKDGKDYYNILLGDKTGEINGKVWSDCLEECEKVVEGDIVRISANPKKYNGKMQLTIQSMQKINNFDPADFLAESEHDISAQYAKFLKYIKSVEDKNIRKLLEIIFVDNESFIKEFKKAFGAEKAHHAYLGGLLEHILEMLDFIEPVAKNYNNLNRDLLIAGVILHDIGKVFELKIDVNISRTREGHLLGHITQGTIFVDKNISQIKNFPQELREQILHMILSHHGKLEFGSPVMPMTQEAIVLHNVDVMSSKLNMTNKIIDKASPDQIFTDFSYLLESRFYTGNLSPEKDKVDLDEKQGYNDAKHDMDGDQLSRNLQIPF